MKAHLQIGSSLSACGRAQAGRQAGPAKIFERGGVPAPPEKRFLINGIATTVDPPKLTHISVPAAIVMVFLIILHLVPANARPTGTHRIRLTIDPARVRGSELRNFPVYTEIAHPDLVAAGNGGHAVSETGADIYFTDSDGFSRIPHETVAYDPERGRLRAWVRIPVLSGDSRTGFFLYYGNLQAVGETTASVWDPDYALVGHDTGVFSVGNGDHDMTGKMFGHEITVQAWVSSEAHRPETIQPLVSKWSILDTFDTFDSYDAGDTDGLACVGYYGAIFDGRYVYWCPIRENRDRHSVHARVLRYDTHGDFHDPASYRAFDAGNTSGLNTVCYYGAAFDGRYILFVPRDDGARYHSRILRYDTRGDFMDPASWDAYDAGVPHSHQGAAFDGRYVYFCPGYDGSGLDGTTVNESVPSGAVLRYDTHAPFHDPAGYRVFDTRTISEETVNFDGAAFDGRYIYFVPLVNGVVLRYDTHAEFGDRSSWSSYDAKPKGMKLNVGALFDGRYVTFVAYGHSVMVRYDTQGAFRDDASWEAFDAGNTGGLDTGGYNGGFFDGKYVYFSPWVRQVAPGSGKSRIHANFLRYDTRKPFGDPGSWTAHDASAVGGLRTVGYNAGAFDGRYFYAAPLYDGEGDRFHGRILRYDTVGDNGSFSLKYSTLGHNGGLCAALPGPVFLVNTDRGPLSIAAHKTLQPGRNHLSGVYNGETIKLFVNGGLVAAREGGGRIMNNDIAVSIGALHQGTAHFFGVIHEVRVSTSARDDDWIATEYENLADPEGFIRAGQSEKLDPLNFPGGEK